MKFIEIKQFGGPDVMMLAEGEIPSPGPGQVLIQVAAAGVNRPDLFQRQGHYPPPAGASDIPGLEVAGEVIKIADDVESPQVGDEVCVLVTGGGYAEYIIAEAPICLPVPKGLTAVEAAAIPETFFTVWSNVFERAALQAGESLLVHGGSSGIGTTAIQLGKAFGARVFATAGSKEKCEACRRLGAMLAINYKEKDFVAECKAATDDKGIDVILDMVAGDYIGRDIKLAAVEGRIIIIAGLQGYRTEIDLFPLMLKRLYLTGSTLRARSVEFKADIARKLKQHVWPILETGEVKPVIYRTFPLGQAAEAHRVMESSRHIGKIVLLP
ncbi:MAG: NAD(P)H-quinone oxidoreductase [Gammaproteobacteria bacterium]